MSEEKLTTEQVAAYLGYSAGTVENWRQEKPYKGPRYYKPMGKVFYYKADLDAWIHGERKNEYSKENEK